MDNTGKTLSAEKSGSDRFFTLRLLIVMAAAFAAAMVLRPSSGIFAMLPISVILCLISSLIKLSIGIKLISFGVLVFAMNSIEHGDFLVSVIYAAICVLACVLFELAVRFFRKSRLRGYIAFALSAVICVTASFLLVGDPFRAYDAREKILAYTEKCYPEMHDGSRTEYDVSEIRYDLRTKSYSVDVVNSDFPTDRAAVSLSGEYIYDGFADLMEFNLMNARMLELTSTLRDAFPDDSFEVTQLEIARFPSGSIAEGDLGRRMSFEIHIGGIQLTSEFSERAKKYASVIDTSGLTYSEITFTAGSGYWYRWEATVDYDHFIYRAPINVQLGFIGRHDTLREYKELVIAQGD